ncbi:uncharacterized protein CLUP02_06620 [Colletotrichum lupini]|uniref:Uncharacterized protein n=1 Tax=Colletotrichum lupini TaxID=145971 RepID=A0A9Q8SPG1_9PEZI|nr:uncharacterized protein CLUP02_06620 [Colletotrichum lupini]UQC81134.1 hypothetical protein CLUP02_06620 [Colletotrichum lupini]
MAAASKASLHVYGGFPTEKQALSRECPFHLQGWAMSTITPSVLCLAGETKASETRDSVIAAEDGCPQWSIVARSRPELAIDASRIVPRSWN